MGVRRRIRTTPSFCFAKSPLNGRPARPNWHGCSLGDSEGAHRAIFGRQTAGRDCGAIEPRILLLLAKWSNLIGLELSPRFSEALNFVLQLFSRLCAPLFRVCTTNWCACSNTVPQVSSNPHGSAKKCNAANIERANARQDSAQRKTE